MTRILHVFGALDRGGAETWLLSVLCQSKSRSFEHDVCLLAPYDGPLVEAYEQIGCPTFHCPAAPLLSFPLRLYFALRAGEYDVVHSHVFWFSGLIVLLARLAGVRARIAHSHNVSDGARPTVWRRAYREVMRMLLLWNATQGLACSVAAGSALFGHAAERNGGGEAHRGSQHDGGRSRLRSIALALPSWGATGRRYLGCIPVAIVPYGIDLARFARSGNERALRRSLGLSNGDRLVVHAGSLTPQKNQRFLLRVFAEAHRLDPNLRLAIAGDGPLRRELERKIRALGIADSVTLLGDRDDMPSLLTAASAFALTSLYEGFPLSLLEARASGLPCLIPSHIDHAEAEMESDSIRTVAIDDRLEVWAAALVNVSLAPRTPFAEAHARLQRLGHDDASSATALQAVYLRAAAGSTTASAVRPPAGKTAHI